MVNQRKRKMPKKKWTFWKAAASTLLSIAIAGWGLFVIGVVLACSFIAIREYPLTSLFVLAGFLLVSTAVYLVGRRLGW